MALLFAVPNGLVSQERNVISADSLAQLVVSVSAASLPRALVPACGETSGRVGTGALGLSLLVPVAGVWLETEVAKYGGGESNCPLTLVLRNGVQTVGESLASRKGPMTLGLSVEKPFGPRQRWDVGVGGGWTVQSKHVPYVRSRIGMQGGQRVRWGLEVVWDVFGVPWKETTAEYNQGSVVNVISERSYRSWASSMGLRIRIGFPLVGK